MGRPMVPRMPVDFPANKFMATQDEIAQLQHEMSYVPSTVQAVLAWPRRSSIPQWEAFKADPILALLRIVQMDSKAFFQNLEWALDEISQDSLDDYLMNKRLEDWRKLMSDFAIELPAIDASLRAFLATVFREDQHAEYLSAPVSVEQQFQNLKLPEELKNIVEDLDTDIKRLKKRLDEAYTALRADMQFAESRRSIAETKSVSKLTELAFLFIPLSFTCSLFSMSIIQLQKGVPLWIFILTAVIVVIISYIIRLLVASDLIADSTYRALRNFRDRDGQPGESVSPLTLIVLIVQDLWSHGGSAFIGGCSFFLFVSALIVIPIAFLWRTTKLDVGFNIAVTLFLIVSSFALAAFIFLTGGDEAMEGVSRWFKPRMHTELDMTTDDV